MSANLPMRTMQMKYSDSSFLTLAPPSPGFPDWLILGLRNELQQRELFRILTGFHTPDGFGADDMTNPLPVNEKLGCVLEVSVHGDNWRL